MNENERGKYNMDCNVLLIKIMERHEITVDQMALLTGYSSSNAYKWVRGERWVPLFCWQSLYKKTRDMRILQLITGDLNVVVVNLPEPEKTSNAAAIKHMVATIRGHMEVMKPLTDIFEDGVVDGKDFQAVPQFEEAADRMVETITQAKHAIRHEFDNKNQRGR